MKDISKKEALEIAKRIILKAEKERLEIKDKEANIEINFKGNNRT